MNKRSADNPAIGPENAGRIFSVSRPRGDFIEARGRRIPRQQKKRSKPP